MNYIIRKEERKDCADVAHVVTVAWNETYKGIVPDDFLEGLYLNEEQRAINSYNKFVYLSSKLAKKTRNMMKMIIINMF